MSRKTVPNLIIIALYIYWVIYISVLIEIIVSNYMLFAVSIVLLFVAISIMNFIKQRAQTATIFYLSLFYFLGPTSFGLFFTSSFRELPFLYENFFSIFYGIVTLFFNLWIIYKYSSNEDFLIRSKISITFLIAIITIVYTFFKSEYLYDISDTLFLGVFSSYLIGIGFIEKFLYEKQKLKKKL